MAYTGFHSKLKKIVNEIAPSKEIRNKNNVQECFDKEIDELIHLKFKKSKLHNHAATYKKVSLYQVQSIIKKRKENSMKLILNEQ